MIATFLSKITEGERDFLWYAASLTGFPVDVHVDAFVGVGSKDWRFFVSRKGSPVEFSLDAGKHGDVISSITLHHPQMRFPHYISVWREDFQNAVSTGTVTDFRTITLLTAILNYKP